MNFSALCLGWITMSDRPTIIYTKTDESPALATASLLPIIQAFSKPAGIDVERRDISLAARILAAFPEYLTAAQRIPDALTELSTLITKREANIVKLPNVSAPFPQLKAAIGELQSHGYALPVYPDSARTRTTDEKTTKSRYDLLTGSAVNSVLRQGNSDRRVPQAVKAYARKHPPVMGAWSPLSKTTVATMAGGDFFHNEKSCTVSRPTHARIEFRARDGTLKVLKDNLPLSADDILDGTFMSERTLVDFLERQIARSKRDDLLFSLHLKATMMKVSDPIMFGHAVRIFFRDLLKNHTALLKELNVDLNNGLAELVEKTGKASANKKSEVEADIRAECVVRGGIAMTNSAKGITNLHVPSQVIVDSSMPALIRASGKMYDAKGELRDTLAVIPDSTYAGFFQTVIDFCKEHGAFDPRTMGSVSNVGLMAQAAEEYGSHETTFHIGQSGSVRVTDESGRILLQHAVESGDIWRACRTTDEAVQDWVRLAVRRARATRIPTVFWLDEKRAHDAEIIARVKMCLLAEDTTSLDFRVLPPAAAMRFTLGRVKAGEDTISVTGNIFRDYLTDLFPILELGTSAKMLSIIPLLRGGSVFETGAGGTAPKLFEVFLERNHFVWDSLGEFLALATSLGHVGETSKNSRATILADTLDEGIGGLLENDRLPSASLASIDTRLSHFYLARYWADALARQTRDSELKRIFEPVAAELIQNEHAIVDELSANQENPVKLGGYFQPDENLLHAAMCPSGRFNAILGAIESGAMAVFPTFIP